MSSSSTIPYSHNVFLSDLESDDLTQITNDINFLNTNAFLIDSTNPLIELATGPTPPANRLSLYAKTDSQLYIRNSLGIETLISGGGGGAVPPGTNYSNYLYWDDASGDYLVGDTQIKLGKNSGKTAQGINTVAMGVNAGSSGQNTSAIAIGLDTGSTGQGIEAIAVGKVAGNTNQGLKAIALGTSAGNNGQLTNAVAIGESCGANTQGVSAIAIGRLAGTTNQGTDAIAIGDFAGNAGQLARSIAIGTDAGSTSQGLDSIAIGTQAGVSTQGANCVAIGNNAGNTGQLGNSIAIGNNTGSSLQGTSCIAIGDGAASSSQGNSSIAIGLSSASSQGSSSIAIGNTAGATQNTNCVAIGSNAGTFQQASCIAIGNNAGLGQAGTNSIAIGSTTGQTAQSSNCVAIGNNAGNASQSSGAVAIGLGAGATSQAANSIAIGTSAGNTSLQANSIAIGNQAAASNSFANSITLNASGVNLPPTNSGFFVSPITSVGGTAPAEYLGYNNTTKEIVRTTVAAGAIPSVFAEIETSTTVTTKTFGALNTFEGFFSMTPGAVNNVTVFNGTAVLPATFTIDIAGTYAFYGEIAIQKTAGGGSSNYRLQMFVNGVAAGVGSSVSCPNTTETVTCPISFLGFAAAGTILELRIGQILGTLSTISLLRVNFAGNILTAVPGAQGPVGPAGASSSNLGNTLSHTVGSIYGINDTQSYYFMIRSVQDSVIVSRLSLNFGTLSTGVTMNYGLFVRDTNPGGLVNSFSLVGTVQSVNTGSQVGIRTFTFTPNVTLPALTGQQCYYIGLKFVSIGGATVNLLANSPAFTANNQCALIVTGLAAASTLISGQTATGFSGTMPFAQIS